MILLHHMTLYVTLLHCLTWPYTNHMWHYNLTCTRCTTVFLLVHMFTGREGTQQRWRGPDSPWLFFLLDFVSVILCFNSTNVNACSRNLRDNFWQKFNVLVLFKPSNKKSDELNQREGTWLTFLHSSALKKWLYALGTNLRMVISISNTF